MNVLVTGGAGYIGSHMVHVLRQAGHQVVVVDNLQAGHADAVPDEVELVRCDIRDASRVTEVVRKRQIDSVIHFAARIEVGESVRDPRLYFRDNLSATVLFLDTLLDEGVRRIVFSSTAAVYGSPTHVPISEDHPTAPINPYGASKLGVEQVLREYSRAYGLSFAALRYFNAAGAHPAFGLRERHSPETHLIPNVIDAVLGRREAVTLFGEDYPTKDGTCVRDYVHVLDLAEAHLSALSYLADGGESGSFNLGTGQGTSVREIVDEVARVAGKPVPYTFGPRRDGDPAELVALPTRAESVLRWKASRRLPEIVADAYRSRV